MNIAKIFSLAWPAQKVFYLTDAKSESALRPKRT